MTVVVDFCHFLKFMYLQQIYGRTMVFTLLTFRVSALRLDFPVLQFGFLAFEASSSSICYIFLTDSAVLQHLILLLINGSHLAVGYVLSRKIDITAIFKQCLMLSATKN